MQMDNGASKLPASLQVHPSTRGPQHSSQAPTRPQERSQSPAGLRDSPPTGAVDPGQMSTGCIRICICVGIGIGVLICLRQGTEDCDAWCGGCASCVEANICQAAFSRDWCGAGVLSTRFIE